MRQRRLSDGISYRHLSEHGHLLRIAMSRRVGMIAFEGAVDARIHLRAHPRRPGRRRGVVLNYDESAREGEPHAISKFLIPASELYAP